MTIDILSKYSPADKMSALISENFQLLQILSRFGIPLGFGDDSIGEICRHNGVDPITFLHIVNFVLNPDLIPSEITDISVEALLNFLRQSHIYFLDFLLPAIRRKLLEGIHLRSNDVSFLIMRFFDDYVNEVATHMQFEEETVFRYVHSLLARHTPEEFHFITYSEHHEEVGAKLKELKNLIIRYCPTGSDPNLLNEALYDIYRCEKELESHCRIEDYLLMPAVANLEKSLS